MNFENMFDALRKEFDKELDERNKELVNSLFELLQKAKAKNPNIPYRDLLNKDITDSELDKVCFCTILDAFRSIDKDIASKYPEDMVMSFVDYNHKLFHRLNKNNETKIVAEINRIKSYFPSKTNKEDLKKEYEKLSKEDLIAMLMKK